MKKKIVFAAIAAVVGAVALYVGVNSIDADPPDVSAFTTTSEIPADEDNAWCGFVAATNAVKRSVEMRLPYSMTRHFVRSGTIRRRGAKEHFACSLLETSPG